MHAAAREVFEEVGFDCTPLIREKDVLKITINDHAMSLYIVPGLALLPSFCSAAPPSFLPSFLPPRSPFPRRLGLPLSLHFTRTLSAHVVVEIERARARARAKLNVSRLLARALLLPLSPRVVASPPSLTRVPESRSHEYRERPSLRLRPAT